MTIILFLVDSSASMGQKTYLGTTYLDAARTAIELFWKMRQKDPISKGDRYMLMNFDDFPKNVKSGWRESQGVLQEQLKNLQACGLTAFGPALGSAFRFVNLNRSQSGIENYGYGRHPYYVEPVVIVAFTDGGTLNTLNEGTTDEIKFMKPSVLGTELTDEPFRWDQRLYTVVFRYPGYPSKNRVPPVVHPDRSHIDVMCQATGGRSYCVLSHRMLQQVIEDILKRVQIGGVLARFEKTSIPSNLKPLENENGPLIPLGAAPGEAFKSQLMLVCKPMRIGPTPFIGHWPIPEAFWPDSIMATLPPRKAHPAIYVRCEAIEFVVNNDFPFDKYELEPSPLTQMILERRQVNACWQVFVMNSGPKPGMGHPFGFIKPSSNMLSVNLYIMPYNYPAILTILEELKDNKLQRNSVQLRAKLEKYLCTVPHYYYSSLKKALKRVNITHQILDDAGTLYSYNVVNYLNKIKAVSKEEQEILNCQVAENLQHSVAAIQAVNHQVTLIKALHSLVPIDERKKLPPILGKDKEKDKDVFKITLIETKSRIAGLDPSSYFRNPFDIERCSLISQLNRMKMNFDQRLSDSTIPVLEGGMPGQRIKLQQAESLHNQLIGTMGDYNTYMTRLKALGGGARKLNEEKMARFHAFGNPFKEKKGMAVDEVGTFNEASSSGSPSPKNAERPRHRKKSGPLQFETGSAWRKRFRSRSESDTSSVVSDLSDIGSISSLENDVVVDEDVPDASTDLVIVDEDDEEAPENNGEEAVHDRPSTNGDIKGDEEDQKHARLNGKSTKVSRKRKASPEHDGKAAASAKKRVKQHQKKPLSKDDLRARKLEIAAIARGIYERPEKICQRCVESVSGDAVEDKLKLLRAALQQARKLQRARLITCLEEEVVRLRDEKNANRNTAAEV
ncbi:hypothetical protein QR680_016810 [Steinernema hermaphroditum]|uniref:VWFA domain-containing protein n=1 Tax=Steinernema hermaphroditum TaxID=289476 RepID=A0AA39LN61_9BILA|nr:hypothetical protein QR680_016810 [Steinernema hermaphroditum]